MFRRSSRGFTLVELIMTSAIIGILAAMAVRSVRNVISRSRQGEAKTHLSLAYVTERNFYLQQQSYTTCLTPAGIKLDSGTRYYAFGFNNPALPTAMVCGPSGDRYCVKFSWNTGVDAATDIENLCTLDDGYFRANAGMNNSIPTDLDIIPSTVERDLFDIHAIGDVGEGVYFDEWAINQDKSLRNVASGL